MIELTCPQCRTKLPVAEEKIGKTLFVCPSCAFPLDAPGTAPDPAPPIMAGGYGGYASPPPAPAPMPMPRRPTTPVPLPSVPTEITLTDAPPLRPIKPSGKTPRVKADPAPPPAAPPVSGSRRGWLISAGAAAGTFLLAGVLCWAFWPSKPKMGLLEVLARSEDLQSPDRETRARAARDLAEAGPEAQAALPALLDALRDDDDGVRSLVADALDKVGTPTEDDLPTLSAALRDNDPDVKAYAVSVIDTLGEKSWGEIDQVRLLTRDPDPQVKAEAEKTLERLEANIIEALTARLKDPKPDVRSKAAEGLGELGIAAKPATSSLMEAMTDENEAVRAAVSKALAQFGAEIVPVLADALKNPSVVARRTAVVTLGSMKEEAVEAVPKIAAVVDDPDIGEEAAAVLVKDFGPIAVADVAAVVGGTTVVRRREVLLNRVLIPIGDAALPALKVYVNRYPSSTVVFNQAFPQLVTYVPPPVTIVAPTGLAGVHYGQLIDRFNGWWTKEGYLDHARAQRELGWNKATFNAFMKQVDRNGLGRIHRNDYQRWANEHAHQLAKEEQASKALHEAQKNLHNHVAESTKKAQSTARASYKAILKGQGNKQEARKAAEANLNTARRKAQAQHVKAQKDVQHKQHEAAKMQRHNSLARHVAPHKPPAAPKTNKSPNRKPVVNHAPAHKPPPKKGRR